MSTPDVTLLGTHDIPVGELHPHPDNPNRGDVDAIKASLTEFGQYRSIVARKDGTILAGHHVWQAATALGWPTVRVDQVDCDDETATRILLADNRIAELGEGIDPERLLAILDDDLPLVGTGYTDVDVDTLREMLDGPPTLDELEDEAGDTEHDDYHERVKLVLDPVVAKGWNQFRDGYDDDTDAMAALLEHVPGQAP